VRPLARALVAWEYVFFIDVEGHQQDEKVSKRSIALKVKTSYLRFWAVPRCRDLKMLMDLCELSPSYVRLDRAVPAGQAHLGARRELGLKEEAIHQARLQREPARHRAAHARGDRAAIGEVARYPEATVSS